MMKYNKGDKVIQIDTGYFTNPYHFKNSFKINTIKDSNERYFTCSDVNINEFIAGCNECLVYLQDGRQLYGNDVYLHIEKDNDLIKSIVETGVKKADELIQKDIKEKTDNIKTTIKRYELRLKEVESRNERLLHDEGFDKFKVFYKTVQPIINS